MKLDVLFKTRKDVNVEVCLLKRLSLLRTGEYQVTQKQVFPHMAAVSATLQWGGFGEVVCLKSHSWRLIFLPSSIMHVFLPSVSLSASQHTWLLENRSSNCYLSPNLVSSYLFHRLRCCPYLMGHTFISFFFLMLPSLHDIT